MRLSQDVIFYFLTKEFPAFYISYRKSNIRFDRPVYFENEKTRSNYLIIINEKDLHFVIENSTFFKNNLIICPNLEDRHLIDLECSVISFSEQVPFESIINSLQIIYGLFDKWEESLTKIYYENGSFQELIDCSDRVIFEPICIVDRQFRYIAYSKNSLKQGLGAYIDSDNKIASEVVNNLITDRKFAELYKIRTVFVYKHNSSEGIVKNIFFEDDYKGRVIISIDTNSDLPVRYYSFILEHLNLYFERLYRKYLSFSKNSILKNTMCDMILNCLKDKKVSDEQWSQTIIENGWSQNDSMQMIQLRPNPRYDKNLYSDYHSAEIERLWQGCVIMEYNNHLLLLVNRDRLTSRDSTSFNQTLAYFLRDSLLVAGLSRPFKEMRFLKSAFEQTEIALELGSREAQCSWYFRFDDYIMKYIINRIGGTLEYEMICSEKLLALKQHDSDKNTEYLKTLQTYIECRFNAVAAAKKLYIQRSTFLYRMEKIQELAKINFESEDELLYLSLSFKLLKNNRCN